MRKNYIKKSLAAVILILFIGASILPSISGSVNKIEIKKIQSYKEFILPNICNEVLDEWSTFTDIENDGHVCNRQIKPLDYKTQIEAKFTIIIGHITKLFETPFEKIKIRAHDVLYISFFPFQAKKLQSLEEIVIIQPTYGIITSNYIFGIFKSAIVLDNPAPQMPGWPQKMEVKEFFKPHDCCFSDVNLDGYMEILSGSTDGSFHIWDYTGKELPGWPKYNIEMIQSKAAIGDVDPEYPGLEIVIAGRDNTLYAWHSDGTNISGWPQTVYEIGGSKSPVLFDLDHDGYLEIIQGMRDYPNGQVIVFNRDGTIFDGWPQPVDFMCVAPPSVGDIDCDGIVEICAVSYYSIYLWDLYGNLEPGWPILNHHDRASYAQPTLADLDDDGDMEILVAYASEDQDYVDIFHHNGESFLDWPYTFPGPQTYMCPVIGDVDCDGDFEIFNGGHVTGGPSFLGRHHTGIELEGHWPVIVDSAECSPIIYDIDNDDEPEIIISDNKIIPTGNLFAFNSDGSIVEGWPIKTSGGSGLGSPCIGDVDLDGDTEIGLVSGYCGTVNLWTFDDVPFNPDKVIWGTHFHDIWNTGCYHTPAPR